MPQKPIKILAINPGSKYLGIAIFNDSDLRYWGIKSLKGKWSKSKMRKVESILTDICDNHQPNVLALKTIPGFRSSLQLDRLIRQIREFSKMRGLRVHEFSLADLEEFLSPKERISKRTMADILTSHYPFLQFELEKEKRNDNPYFIRMFEAIALGIICLYQLNQ